MASSIRLRRLRKAVLASTLAAATVLSMSVLNQRSANAADPAMEGADTATPTPPKAKPVLSKGAEGGVENYAGPKRNKMSPEELGKLRMLEIKSGAFRDAHATAESTQLTGPPLSDREKVMHALTRLSFGHKPGEVEKILLEGGTANQWQSWAKRQLQPDAIEDKAVDDALKARFEWYGKPPAEVKKEFPYENGSEKKRNWTVPAKQLPQSVIMRAAMSNRQFKEVMAEFWREHFTIDNSPGESRARSWSAPDYEENVIRPHIFGKFKMMLFASAKHSAMLEYLDNQVSRANYWNENYARELMELHTVGADRGYTDADVIALSQVLTGWQYKKSDLQFAFNEKDHQPGGKRVMGVVIPGGYSGGEQAIYMLATHPNTADFISRKLCKYLVNDAPPEALVKKVAAVFAKTEGDLSKVYEAIIFSPEFTERANYRSKFRTPFEFTVAAIRTVDGTVESASATADTLRRMGMEIYNCPDPTGYYDRAEAWLDSGVLTSRWDFARDLTRGGVAGVKINPAVMAKYKAMKPDDSYKVMIKDLVGDDIGDKTRIVLKEAADAGDAARMMGVLIGSPSFQQQ